MKIVLYVFVVVLSLSTIVFGHFHWESKLASKVEAAKADVSERETSSFERSATKEPQQDESKSVDQLSSNLPQPLQEQIQTAIHNKTKVKFSIIGSGELNATEGWSGHLAKGLTEAYGEGVFDLQVTGFGDLDSTKVHSSEKMINIAENKPDLVLIEPFIMNDNIGVRLDDSKESIKIIERRLKEENPNVTIFIQPPHPIYDPQHYQVQINTIKEFSAEEDFIYLDHWENWPGVQDEEIKKYIEGIDRPNEKGHKLWSEYLINYFTGK